jgi:glutathione S-transferase
MQFLEMPHEWRHVDILASETHAEEFKRKNPNARIPLLEINDDEYLCESNAIWNCLAFGTQCLPDENHARSKILQWQFF